ncbi:hypothetical protein PLICRDRAFT_124293 [Plicaturopsis crispa FD-325 SS-3]|nr:hypothetical protein PLICRDRAFT_124293 [Plicaturopsis crispa FD-325 SS-3]
MATAIPALDNTLGAALIGVVIAAALWGVSCVQTWFYYTRYQKDPWYIKTLVAGVLFFDTTHQALITHTVYTYVVTDFSAVAELGNLVWSLIVEVLFNGFTALLVQSFLAFRVWRLSNKSVVITGSVALLVAGEFVCVVVYTIKAIQLQTFEQLADLKDLSMAVNVLAAAGDILIALVLCIMLQRSRTGFMRSDSMIRKLMMFTINTGMLTSMCASASLISILCSPKTFIYITFYFQLGRLYSNSLLATLNARKRIRASSFNDDGVLTISQHGLQRSDSRAITGKSARGGANIAIQIDTVKEYTRDKTSTDRSPAPSESGVPGLPYKLEV